MFERYVQEDPLDERVYLRMMEIYESAHLYYKGIRLYQQLVNLLNTELRVAPRREIQELYRKLLHVWSEEGEKEEEHSGEVCTGRERELQLLQASYRQFLSGSPTSVLLSGKSGVGKTYLAERFLEEITGENTVILRAVCLENEQNIVLQPWNTIMMQVNSLLKKQDFALDKKYLQAAELLFPLFDTQDVKEPVLGDTTISYSYRATRNLLIKLFEEIGEQVLVVLFRQYTVYG
ncbi:AAA family ATPase [Blautia sp. RD014234]|nr:AAA family ATPase [Blautia parvula]